MEIPLQLQLRDMEASPEVEQRIRSRVSKLERYCDSIVSCRVLVEQPHDSPSHANR